jgi:RecA-family ATPase
MKPDSVEELLSWTPPKVRQIIGNGILSPGSRAFIYGRWGTWKSMLSMDLAFCIADGLPWMGFDTAKSSVLVSQVEITRHNLQKRVAKYVSSHQTMPKNLWFLTEPMMRLDTDWTYTQFKAMVLQLRPDVIVLDPIYRMVTGNISDNEKMGRVLDRVDELQDKIGCATIIVGHTRKPQNMPPGVEVDMSNELIGASFFQNWADTSISVEPVSDNVVQLRFQKVRNSEDEIKPFRVKIDRETLRIERKLS